MKKAIITGATGAIGTALVAELTNQGVAVLALCHRGGRAEHLPPHPLLKIRYCDLTELAGVCADESDHDVFYHLAWAGTSGRARNDAALQCNNIRYALDAVAAARRFGCHTFIGVGSQAEYGRTQGALTPNTPTFPENGYGMAKLAAGGLTRLAAEACAMRHVWVRILSVYGPHDNESSLISYTVRGLLQSAPLRFTKGEQLWDLLYSRDAARALVRLACRGKHGAVYPLGSGKARPLREYLLAARDAIAPHVPLDFGALPYAPDQVMHLEADLSAITADTDWRPTTDFRTGILETANWWKQKEL